MKVEHVSEVMGLIRQLRIECASCGELEEKLKSAKGADHKESLFASIWSLQKRKDQLTGQIEDLLLKY